MFRRACSLGLDTKFISLEKEKHHHPKEIQSSPVLDMEEETGSCTENEALFL